MSVKAKSADDPTHRLGGLVVDPTMREDAFKDEISYERALAS